MDKAVFNIEDELKKLPGSPGVYLMHDAGDNIIYVGKAVNLRNRVRSYFRKSTPHTPKIEKMISLIARFEYIVTDSELEALVLECNLIKEYAPRYNTMLKDDKTYPYIRVSESEAFPRVLFSRQMKRDSARYFGPYSSAAAVKDTIKLLRRMYRIRSCNRVLPRDIGKERPCIYHYINQCDAPCAGLISSDEYRVNVEKAVKFLNGDYDTVLEDLKKRMKNCAARLEFEEAAAYRDLYTSVEHIAQSQRITDSSMENRDIAALRTKDDDGVVAVLFVRDGKMIGRDSFHMTGVSSEKEEDILSDFVKQYYASSPYLPGELVLSCDITDREIIEKWLSEKRGRKVRITVPKKGKKEKLLELALENAGVILSKDSERLKLEEAKTTGAVRTLSGMLDIPFAKRIEAYDISNISGYENVGSMVVYRDGKPFRNGYRKFKIKSFAGADDYRSLREVLVRRLEHGIREQDDAERGASPAAEGGFADLPDLILMDGGRGQVNEALSVLDGLGLSIPVCGMVKDDHHNTRGLYFNNELLPIDVHSEVFRLITRIQDEAHRFAIEYHRSLRSKGQVKSVLDDIEGIGPARRKALLRAFGSVENIAKAGIEELQAADTMNARAAEAVYRFFRENRGEQDGTE
ncbi:MAG: excinuclease ABC subunit UvrC [Lachnospiraceae bacterium]|nr:excinuclease ABC subunit UvrC [Lachnospiraceae bacterium]